MKRLKPVLTTRALLKRGMLWTLLEYEHKPLYIALEIPDSVQLGKNKDEFQLWSLAFESEYLRLVWSGATSTCLIYPPDIGIEPHVRNMIERSINFAAAKGVLLTPFCRRLYR